MPGAKFGRAGRKTDVFKEMKVKGGKSVLVSIYRHPLDAGQDPQVFIGGKSVLVSIFCHPLGIGNHVYND